MKRRYVVFICMLMFMTLWQTNIVHAHGWGYKKSTNKQQPEIGQYENMIEDYQVYYIDKNTKKDIYLTFDNGYEAGFTNDVLDVLKEEQVPATFFVTGHYVEEEPELIKRMVADNHIIGNHSYHHPDFTTMTKEKIAKELELVEKAVSDITEHVEMKYVRPPRGTFNEQTLKWTEELGYISMFWSLAFKDWETKYQKGAQYAYDQIMEQIHPGAIILLHTVSEDNAKALKKVIQQLKQEGYSFKSLDDLLWKELISEDILFQ